MSKNLTRKSVALGAIVALGSVALAGAPAHAATTNLNLVSSYGTSLNTILGQGFNLSLTAAGLSGTAASDVKLAISGVKAGDLLTTYYRATTDVDADGPFTVGTTAARAVVVDDAAKTAVIQGDASVNSATGVTLTAGNYNQFRIALDSSKVTATTAITVTPFVDTLVTDGKVTPGETAGTPITINFVKAADITATTTLNTPVIGSSELSATVKLDKDINLEQIRANGTYDTNSSALDLTLHNTAVTVDFKVAGTTIATNGLKLAAWKKSAGALYATAATASPINATTLYTAQAKINATASGTASSASATAGTVDVVDAGTLNAAAANVVATKGANVRADNVASFGVRTGTTTVALSSGTIYKLNTDSTPTAVSVGAGVPAQVTVTPVVLGSSSSFAAGGKSSAVANQSFTFDTTTNADGKVAFDLTATGAAADAVSVEVKVLDLTTYKTVGQAPVSLVWVTGVAHHLVNLGTVGNETSGNGSIAVKGGTSYTLNYGLYDDFGALYSGTSERRVYVDGTAGSGGTVVGVSTYGVVTGGKVSFTFTDANTGVATNDAYFNITAVVKASGSSWTASGVADAAGVTADGDNVTKVYSVKDATPGFLTIAKANNPAISYKTLVSLDGRADSNSWAAISGYGQAATISGNVYDASGTALIGSPVTISAPGVLFVSGNVKSLGSITVLSGTTGSNGSYSVDAYSNKAGEQVITATAGALTKTTTPKWSAAGIADADTITITAPTSAAPGTTVGVTIKLTDKYGNPVAATNTTSALKVTVSGVGSTGSFTAATDSDGLLKINQVLGSNETGSFTVKVEYDADGNGVIGANNTTAIAAISKSATVTVAATAPVAADPSAKIGTASHRVFVKIFDAKGARVSVKIDGKWFVFYNSNFSSPTVWSKYFALVKTGVKVYVDGDLVAAKTIKVVK